MKTLDKISSGINRAVMVIAVCFLVVLLASSTVQIVSRYVFNSSIVWTEELARYCFIWLNLLGTSILVKSGGHAVVDMITKRMTPGVKKVYSIIMDLAMFYVGVVFVRFGWQLVTVVKNQKSPAMHISMAYVYSAVMVCGILICFHLMVRILNKLFGEKEA